MRLQGKTALITGGNSGIGLAAARLFIAEGAKVAITGRNQVSLDTAGQELGPNALALRADTTDAVAMEAAVAAAVAKFGKLDVVFANAGIAGLTPMGKTALKDFEAILSTNLTAVFFTVQAALPYLNDRASVIFNSSVIASLGSPGYSAYAASKAGVRSMARVLASELSPRGIRVNVITPGAARTPIWSSSAPSPEAMVALETRISRGIPMGRLSEATEIAQAALFLASDESSGMQAAEITVDGGSTGAPSGAPIYRTPPAA